MYNQYLSGQEYFLVEPEPVPEPHSPSKAENQTSSDPLGEVSGGISRFLTGILKHFDTKRFDAGDILLVLIILFLFLEGDNLEVVITLGLMLLLGLGKD